MNQQSNHPDMLALAEGRLNSEDRMAAQAHMAECPECRREYQEIGQELGIIEKITKEARAAFSQPGELDRLAAELLDPVPGEASFSLDRRDMTYTLPAALQQRLAPKSGLAERLSHAAQALGGLGKEAAQALGERIASGGAAAMGAPAVRKDATDVEDEGPGPDDPQPPARKPKL